MHRKIHLLAVLLIFAFPVAGRCCEPIVPLYKLLSGSTLAGPAILTESIWWLLAAVIIKTAAFVFFERRLSWSRAIVCMLLANVLSTVPGVLVAGFTSSVAGIVLALPIVFLLGWLVKKRFSALPPSPRRGWLSGPTAGFMFIGVFAISLVLFGFAGSALDQRNYVTYWILKFFFVALAASSGIIISAVLEECVIARMTRKQHAGASYFTSVFRANYITLTIVLLFVAAHMLPQRLKSPNFIVGWLQALGDLLSV